MLAGRACQRKPAIISRDQLVKKRMRPRAAAARRAPRFRQRRPRAGPKRPAFRRRFPENAGRGRIPAGVRERRPYRGIKTVAARAAPRRPFPIRHLPPRTARAVRRRPLRSPAIPPPPAPLLLRRRTARARRMPGAAEPGSRGLTPMLGGLSGVNGTAQARGWPSKNLRRGALRRVTMYSHVAKAAVAPAALWGGQGAYQPAASPRPIPRSAACLAGAAPAALQEGHLNIHSTCRLWEYAISL